MILFYAANDEYGFFSNFSKHPVIIYGRTWKTSEHAFQAMKFSGGSDNDHSNIIQKIWEAKTPGQAAKIGRDRSNPLRKDWEEAPGKRYLTVEDIAGTPAYQYRIAPPKGSADGTLVITKVKDLCMYEVIYAKFTQNKELREEILKTGNEYLVEDANHDPYWGWGASKVGRNKLGRILMMVRTAISTNSGAALVIP
jgi:predicted NAD-dependent protein-ADP-ribosyltransferase YbiA (DUF1768 family)